MTSIASIDGSFMLHRARFVAGKNGTPTMEHTVALFTNILIRTLLHLTPKKVYIYFDRERSYHRTALYPDYKGQRKEDENDQTLTAYKLSREFLVSALPSLGFITVLKDGIEADDFAYKVAYSNAPGIHVTDDKDWFGNLFPGWSVFRPKAKEFVSYEKFVSLVNNGENPRMIYLIARAIVGDKSDNILGIRGIPWDEALSLAPRILSRQELGDSKYAKKVQENMPQVRKNITIMSPVWTVQSTDVHEALQQAEESVSTDFSNVFLLWHDFCEKIPLKGPQQDVFRLLCDYTHITQNFVR